MITIYRLFLVPVGALMAPALIGDRVLFIYYVIMISCDFRIFQLLCFFIVFLIVDNFKPCVLHGLQDSVAVHGSGTQMSGNIFLTSTCDGSVGSLTSRWGSLLLFPDPVFHLHVPRTLCMILIPQYLP